MDALAEGNPFPGLRPFEAQETHLFFGRDGQSAAIIVELQRTRFVAVVGTSGSGKSSLVRAGLLPQLEGGFMRQAGSFWRIAVMKPGEAPIRNLAQALASPQVLGEGAEETAVRAAQLEAVLRRGSLGLIEAVRQARLESGDNLLIVVDQFEELFRMARLRATGSQDEAAAFVALLLEVSRQTELPVYVVLTMRSDFLGDCAQFRELPEALNQGQYLVPRMSRDERRAAIEGPVAVGGARIAPRLVQQLLNDVGDNPDQLPVMQHALMRTWEAWKADGRPDAIIDLEHYRRIGSLDKALSDHADQALAELTDPPDRAIARSVFQRLCERTADYRETRRPTRLSELCEVANAPEAKVIAVIDRFRTKGRTFLVPPWPTELDGETVIDISHEALIRQWGTLRSWVEEEADSAAMYQRLAVDAAMHADRKVSLWRDPQLRAALAWRETVQPTKAWASRYHPGFGAAMNFLDDSARAQQRTRIGRLALFGLVPVLLIVAGVVWKILSDNSQLAEQGELLARAVEEQQRVNTELQGKQQTIETQRDELVAKADLLELQKGQLENQAEKLNEASTRAIAEASFAQSESRRAQQLGREATASKLAVQSLIENDSETAALLAVEALGFARNEEAVFAMWQALGRPPQLAPLRHADLRATAVSSNGQRVATVGRDRSIVLWDASSGRELGRASLANVSAVPAVAVSPNGDKVFIAGEKPYVAGFEGRAGQLRPLDGPVEQPHAALVTQLRLSPDGRWLATGDKSGQVALWDVSGGLNVRHRLPKHSSDIVDLAFDPSGRWLATAGRDRRVQVVETATGQPVVSFSVDPGTTPGPQVRFAGDVLVVLAGAATIQMRKAPTFDVALSSDDARNRNQRSVIVGASGRSIYSVTTDGNLQSWAVAGERFNVRSSQPISRFGGTRSALPPTPTMVALVESADEQLVAFVVRDPSRGGGHIVIASPSATGSTTVISLPRRRLGNLTFANSDRVLLVSAENEVLRFDLNDLGVSAGRYRLTEVGTVGALAVASGEGARVVAIDSRNTVSKVDAASLEKLSVDMWKSSEGSPQTQTGRPFAISPDHAGIVLSPVVRTSDDRPNGALAWVDANGRRVDLPVPQLEPGSVVALAAAAPARRVAWAIMPIKNGDTQIQIWDTESRTVTHTVTTHEPVKALAMSRDGRWLGAVVADSKSSQRGRTRFPDTDTKLELRTWELLAAAERRDGPRFSLGEQDDDDRQSLEFGAGGRFLIVHSRSNFNVLDWRNGAAAKPTTPELRDVNAYVLATNEERLATVDRTRGVVLHVLGPNAAAPRRLIADDAGVAVLAFTPDSQFLVGGATDGGLYVWDAVTGQPRVLLRSGHRRAITAIGFSADGRTMASGDLSGGVVVWSLSALRTYPAVEASLCMHVGSNMNFGSWQTYMKDTPYRRTCPNALVGYGVAQGFVEQAWQEADKGNQAAVRKLVGSMVAMADGITDANTLNNLCYEAALAGAGREVLPLCERAVKANPQNGHVRDSRGLALALAGRHAEATADFRAALADAKFPDNVRAGRSAWVRALERGVNPLDAKTLRALRAEARG